jgi:hypothetical protein
MSYLQKPQMTRSALLPTSQRAIRPMLKHRLTTLLPSREWRYTAHRRSWLRGAHFKTTPLPRRRRVAISWSTRSRQRGRSLAMDLHPMLICTAFSSVQVHQRVRRCPRRCPHPRATVHDVEAWIALIITTAGTIVGAATGAIIALKAARNLSKDERVAAERADNLRSFRIFVAETVLSVSELRQIPPVPEPRPTDRLIEMVERPLRRAVGCSTCRSDDARAATGRGRGDRSGF